MTFLEQAELPPPRAPQILMGAASPLWGYFGMAAAGGVAWWWMTRWTRVNNLEALLAAPGLAAEAAVAEGLDEFTPAAIDEAVETELPPVGGEAAPVSPLLAATEPVALEAGSAAEPTQPAIEPAPPVDEPRSIKPARTRGGPEGSALDA
jgi:hypothetical protein